VRSSLPFCVMAVTMPETDGHRWDAECCPRGEHRARGCPVVRVSKIEGIGLEEVFVHEPEHVGVARDHLCCGLDDEPVELAALLECLFGEAALGHVDHVSLPVAARVLLVSNDDGGLVDPDDLAACRTCV
jgi:hypothetical protein